MSKKPSGLVNAYVILGLLFIALIGIRTISTPEIWSHLAQGRGGEAISFIEADGVLNTTFLYDKLVYGLWSMGGATALVLFHVACMLVSFVLLLNVAKKWGGPISQGLALLVSGHLIFQTLDVGPRSVMMLFISLFLYILSTVKKPAILFLTLIPLQILWTNMHDSFVFGPFIVAIAAIQVAQEGKRKRSAHSITMAQMAGLVAALLISTILNPGLFGIYPQVIVNLTQFHPSYGSSLLLDFFHVPSNDPLVFFTLVLGAAGLITLKKRLPILLTTLAMIGAFFLVRSPLASQLFVALAFPFMVLSFSAVGEYLSGSFKTLLGAKEKMTRPLSLGIYVLLILFSLIPILGNCAYTRSGSASTFGLGAEEKLFPSGAKKLLEDPRFPEKAINLPADGGYLALTYNRKIFLDYRPGCYKEETVKLLANTLRGDRKAYDELYDTYRPEAFILNTLQPSSVQGIVNLLSMGIWRLAYFDGTTAILLLNKKEFAPLLNDPEIQQAGLDRLESEKEAYAKKASKGCHAGNAPVLLGAGSVFLAFNRPEESEALFSIVLEGYQGIPGAWIGLGKSQLMLKKPNEAMDSLKKAISQSPDSIPAWFAYAKACRYAQNTEEELKATQKLQQLMDVQKQELERLKKKEEEKSVTPPPPTPKKSDSDLLSDFSVTNSD